MINYLSALSLLCLALLFTACGSDSPPSETDPTETITDGPAPVVFEGPFAEVHDQLSGTPDASAVQRRLLELFPSVSNPETGALDTRISRQFVALAESFADKFPGDTVAAPPLYNAAEVALALGQPQRAADIYGRIYNQFRGYSKAPEALFMLAFTHDENLNDLDGARKYYQQFIDTYPNHTFADDSEMLIQNLGKSDEEILRELEAKRN